MNISFHAINKVTKAGNIGAKYTNTVKDIVVEYKRLVKYVTYEPSYGPDKEIVEWNEEIDLINVEARVFARQITDNVYEEIEVINPRSIYGVTGYQVSTDCFDERLLIPIDYDIAKKMTILKRGPLYMRSLNIVFNSRVVVKLKWYQTAIFQGILFVAATVITAFSFGLDGGSALATVVGLSNATLVAVLAVLEAIIVKTVTAKIVALLFAELVKITGLEVAMILAVALAAAGISKMYQNGTFSITPTATQRS